MNGQYRVKNPGLRPLYEQACRLAGKFSSCTFRHVRREDNHRADRLVNQALDRRGQRQRRRLAYFRAPRPWPAQTAGC